MLGIGNIRVINITWFFLRILAASLLRESAYCSSWKILPSSSAPLLNKQIQTFAHEATTRMIDPLCSSLSVFILFLNPYFWSRAGNLFFVVPAKCLLRNCSYKWSAENIRRKTFSNSSCLSLTSVSSSSL